MDEVLSSLAAFFLTTADPSKAALTLPPILDLGAVAAGAVSGALEACDRRLDIVGVLVLSFITALGGGAIRDMLLPTDSVYMLDTPLAVILTAVIGLAAFFFSSLLYKLDKPIAVFDIISVALFVVSGTEKTLMCGYGLLPCVLMGSLTGVGGGVVRDVCLGRIPKVFMSSNYYAICAVVGAAAYYGLVEAHVVKTVAAAACVAIVVGLRWASLRYHLITATPVDLSAKLMGPLGRLAHRRRAETKAGADGRPGEGGGPAAEDAAAEPDIAEPGAEKGR